MYIAKAALRWTLEAEDGDVDITGVITVHVRRSDGEGPWTEIDLGELAARLEKWWAEPADLPEDHVPLRNWYPAGFRLDGIDVHQVSPAVGDTVIRFPVAATSHGGGSGVMLAPQLALVLGLRTDTDTRRGRGRIYLPGFAVITGFGATGTREGFVADELRQILARLAADLSARIEHDPLELTNWALVVYSRVDDAANGVLTFSIPDRVATQRRRAARAVQHAFDIFGEPLP